MKDASAVSRRTGLLPTAEAFFNHNPEGVAMPLSPQGKALDQGKPPAVSEETFLKISKEIAIKFIEVGRVTPTNFDKIFKEIHSTVRESSRSK